ncbi:FG-GAP repeat domain-containing protein [Streptomyces sp. NPDC021100]|uniref:FG-GAP repeat domain-containing protein n=1 Tax=Streptomyces sp. NPDC021100 TaxID=3365114 RepID=UPI0037B71E2A
MRTEKAAAARVPIALGTVLALPAAASADGPHHGTRAAAAPELGAFPPRTGTAPHETGRTFEFSVADWNRDGRPDLIAVKKSGTRAHSAGVHVLG